MKPPEEVASGWARCKDGKAVNYHRNNWLKYKLTEMDFARIWAEQQGRCGVCKTPLAHPTLRQSGNGAKCIVDHRHVKGEVRGQIAPEQVRGLLCRNCNELLGAVRESVHTFEGAANWLKRHGVSEWEYAEAPVAAPEIRRDEMEVTELDGTKKTIKRYY